MKIEKTIRLYKISLIIFFLIWSIFVASFIYTNLLPYIYNDNYKKEFTASDVEEITVLQKLIKEEKIREFRIKVFRPIFLLLLIAFISSIIGLITFSTAQSNRIELGASNRDITMLGLYASPLVFNWIFQLYYLISIDIYFSESKIIHNINKVDWIAFFYIVLLFIIYVLLINRVFKGIKEIREKKIREIKEFKEKKRQFLDAISTSLNEYYKVQDLCEFDLIDVKAVGESIQNINVIVQNKKSIKINVHIPHGTYFISSGSHQNMVTRKEYKFILNALESKNIFLPVSCINAHLPIPNNESNFKGVALVSEVLTKFLIESEGEDEMTIQAGVWSITDNLDRESLLTRLFAYDQFGNKQNAISNYHIDIAKKILDKLKIKNNL